MGEYKGKPSGKVARTKKDVGRQSDIKRIGSSAGARKKNLSPEAGVAGVAGAHGRKTRGRKRETATTGAR